MLNTSHRFHGYGSLKNLYQHSQTIRGQGLSLKFAKRNESNPYRVAVVVSRKVSKSAVTRNRIRRRIYEAVRQSSDDINPGTDLVFTVFSEHLKDMSAPKLQTLIRELLQKTK